MIELEYPFSKGPLKFHSVEGFETGVVAYGTDAPSFTNVPNKILYSTDQCSLPILMMNMFI